MSFFLSNLLIVMTRVSCPYLLAATGAIYSEKSGLPNITLDAAMIMGAFMAVVGSYFHASSAVGAVYASLVGCAIGVIYAIICSYMGGDETIVGISFNLIGWGLTTFLLPVVFGTTGSFTSPDIVALPKISIPLLCDIPIIGGVFTHQTPIAYFSWLFVPLTWVILFRTKPGMLIRTCGENPQAAATVGYNVRRVRFFCSTLTGAMCGLAGAHLSLGLMTMFSEKMTAGRGFIALAAVTYAKASPGKVFLVSLLFGLCDVLSNQLQLYDIPSYIVLMLPYLGVVALVMLDPLIAGLHRKRKQCLT